MSLQLFARMTKVNEAERTVTGIIANEAPDRSGEVFDYASSKPHFEKWSGDIAKATDGKSIGNVRAMHGNVAAGVVKQMQMDDVAKSIVVTAHVVDDNEWAKVQKGVYTGFSIGGSYARKWKGDDGLQRYEAKPCEVSLVDQPCNPDATFAVTKADGSEELRKFEAPTGGDDLAKAGKRHSAKDREALDKIDAHNKAIGEHHKAIEGHHKAIAEHQQGIADCCASMGASGSAGGDAADAGDAGVEQAQKLAKAADDMQKLTAERDGLAKRLEDAQAEIKKLGEQPAAPKGAARAVEKGLPGDEAGKQADTGPVLKADGTLDQFETARKLIKISHANPVAGLVR